MRPGWDAVKLMSFGQPLYRWATARRLTAILLLVVAVWTLFPISLQVSGASTGKDGSVPFPCQNRPCGCKTATQCWKKCCCFTNAQKVAWANSHRVSLPDYVVEAARQETGETVAVTTCCLRGAGHTDTASREQPARRRWEITLQAPQCSGIDSSLVGLPICLPPVPRVCVEAPEPARDSFVAFDASCLIPAGREPPTPPPKIVRA